MLRYEDESMFLERTRIWDQFLFPWNGNDQYEPGDLVYRRGDRRLLGLVISVVNEDMTILWNKHKRGVGLPVPGVYVNIFSNIVQS
jgi:hypothetical protein